MLNLHRKRFLFLRALWIVENHRIEEGYTRLAPTLVLLKVYEVESQTHQACDTGIKTNSSWAYINLTTRTNFHVAVRLGLETYSRFPHQLYTLGNSWPSSTNKTREAQLQTLSSMYRSVSSNLWCGQSIFIFLSPLRLLWTDPNRRPCPATARFIAVFLTNPSSSLRKSA